MRVSCSGFDKLCSGVKISSQPPQDVLVFWVYGMPQTLIYSLHNVGHFHQWLLTFTTVLPLEIYTTYWDHGKWHNFILKADDLFTHDNKHKLHAVSIGSLCRWSHHCNCIMIFEQQHSGIHVSQMHGRSKFETQSLILEHIRLSA